MQNLKGQKFNRLMVLEQTDLKQGGSPMWLCQCECGKTIYVSTRKLKSGQTKSCGCLKVEILVNNSTKHNASRTRLYDIYCSIKSRCNNEKCKNYDDYGGRGICLCKEWSNFENFQNWAFKNGYNETLTIDRINNNGNYCPENCRWVTMKQQANNRRNNIIVNIKGKKMTLAECCEFYNLSYNKYRIRYSKGYNIEKEISELVE